MRAREQLVRSRLEIITLAQRLANVSLACRIAGVSRAHFYRIKRAYEKHGKEGLAPQTSRSSQRAIQVSPEMERLILMMTAHYPTIPCAALVTRLKLDGISVLRETVQIVWKRHNLTTRAARVTWMGEPRVTVTMRQDNPPPPDSKDGQNCVPVT